jgi:hypothetical protein
MAVLGSTLPTLSDIARMMDPNGQPAMVIELLSKMYEINADIGWVQGNLPTGHRTTLRTALPTVSYRRFNEGVAPSKSARMQIEVACAMMEAYSEVDARLVKLYGMGDAGAAFRSQEDAGFLEAMNQQFATDLFTGNSTLNPDRFNGFATIYNDVNYGESVSTAKDGAIIDAGGSGTDNTSMWLICWGNDTVHGVYPRGTDAGLKMTDLGEDTKVDANGNMYQVLRSHFTWDVGLAVRDWRYVVRIANIDVSNLLAASSNADLIKLAGRAVDRLPNPNKGRCAWYCNRLVKSVLREQAKAAALYTITLDQVEGRNVDRLYGFPIRIVDALGIAETQLT